MKRWLISIKKGLLESVAFFLTFIIIVDIINKNFQILDKLENFINFYNKFETEYLVNIGKLLRDLLYLYDNKVIFNLIYVIVMILLLLKHHYKNESIKIMIVNTFENTKVNIKTKYALENVEFYKDLSKECRMVGKDYSKYVEIVKELDIFVKEFMQNKDEKYYAFAGILHTPFIFRLGYKIGDQTYFKLFHKNRKEDTFKLLKDKNEYIGNYPNLNVEKNLKESKVLVVSIATTFPITNEDLYKFDIENNNYLKFETEEMGFDVIYSEEQVNDYKKIIFENIRNVYKEKKIDLIHLCISSSVAFSFSLGQGFSEKYDSDIIIYNYESKEYRWGLKLFESPENSIVC